MRVTRMDLRKPFWVSVKKAGAGDAGRPYAATVYSTHDTWAEAEAMAAQKTQESTALTYFAYRASKARVSEDR